VIRYNDGMNILITAGNTQVLIDKVRCLTNIFTGRTGASIARHAHERGHSISLLTSHPEVIADLIPSERWSVIPYRTFEDLSDSMDRQMRSGSFDALIHCAAVSDYLSGGIYSPADRTRFDEASATWNGSSMVDRSAGKVKSDEPELWLRLVRAPKLVDRVRGEWGFRGVLVKFKLEVGKTLDELLAIAERSRVQSDADLMVANTLEGSKEWAIIGPSANGYDKIDRPQLASKILDAIENLHSRNV